MAKHSDPAKIQLWQQRLERFTQAQLSVPDFCAQEGVSVPNFYYRRRRLSPPPLSTLDLSAPAFLPVQLLGVSTPLELLLPTGARLRIGSDCDPQLLQAVLHLLGAAVLTFSPNVCIHLCTRPVDLHLGFDGRAGRSAAKHCVPSLPPLIPATHPS